MDKKVLSLLSLSMGAGSLAVGENNCEKALRSERARLVIIAGDASDNTKKKFINKAFYYKVPALCCGSRDEISKAIGRENRVVVAVTDNNFAASLCKLLQADMEVGGCLR